MLLTVLLLASAIHGAIADVADVADVANVADVEWEDDTGYHYPDAILDTPDRSNSWQDNRHHWHPYSFPSGRILPIGDDGWQTRPVIFSWPKGALQNEMWQQELDDHWDMITIVVTPGDGIVFPYPLLPADDPKIRSIYIEALKQVRIEEEKKYIRPDPEHDISQLQWEWDTKMDEVYEYAFGLLCLAHPASCPNPAEAWLAAEFDGRHPKFHHWRRRIIRVRKRLENDMRVDGLRILGRELLELMYSSGQTFDLHVEPDPTETENNVPGAAEKL